MCAKAKDKKEKAMDSSWKRETGWNKISAADKKKMEAYCREYLEFLSSCKTERLAHDRAVAMAEENGFKPIESFTELKPGARVYRSWRGKTLLLARIGERPMSEGLNIVGGHIDAPRLDTKPNPLYEDGGLALFDTHYYGGIKKYQWVTMPLAIHGVVCLKSGKLVNVSIGDKADDPVFCVTDLLPHLGKDQAEKKMNDAVSGENLNLLVGSIPVKDKDAKQAVKAHILNMLQEMYGIEDADFASAELEIVPAGSARECGLDRSMLIGYGHDDRICAYAGLRAILDVDAAPQRTAVALLCDKEEIGSVGATGMESVFFENTVAELLELESEPASQVALRRTLENSRMISADVHSVHDPNYPEVSSPNNMAQLNAGIVVAKYGGARGKSHSSDASAEFMAVIRRIFDDADVLWQTAELGKVDLGGGGTIAMFLARYGMDVVDAGPGLLSMHAPWEVAGKLDTYMAYKAYAAFLTHTR